MSDSNSFFIDTPENLDLEADIAGFGSRCVAAILDYLILLVVYIVFAILFAQALRDNFLERPWALLALYGFVQLSILVYHLFFEFAWNGQTPGKRRLGIRVVQSNGLPATTTALIIRNLVRLFDFFPILYGLGLATLFATKNTQRLGDLAAKTMVIREQRQLDLHSVREDYRVRYAHISRTEPLPHYVQVGILNEDDRRKVVDYLRRRDQIQRREHIVGLLAQQVAQRMNLDDDALSQIQTPKRAETFLEQVARAFEIAEYDSSTASD